MPGTWAGDPDPVETAEYVRCSLRQRDGWRVGRPRSGCACGWDPHRRGITAEFGQPPSTHAGKRVIHFKRSTGKAASIHAAHEHPVVEKPAAAPAPFQMTEDEQLFKQIAGSQDPV